MKPTLKQKRFLIVWCCFHLLALLVNIVPINGDLSHQVKHNEFSPENNEYNILYVFTNGYDKTDGFWPFVKYSYSKYYYNTGTVDVFNGIFAGYDIGEAVTYILIGIAIVFLPKLWRNNRPL